jgi:membrane fusion protein, copper/silver efflux system
MTTTTRQISRRALPLLALLALATMLWAAARAPAIDPHEEHDYAGSSHADHVHGSMVQQTPGQASDHAGHDMGGIGVHADGTVTLPPEMAASLGVTIATAELGRTAHTVRATGHVVWDETRLATITPKFAGFVERLYVNSTGQRVRRGQPLLEIYSPALVAAQEELLSALRLDERLAGSMAPGVGQRAGLLAESARQKLRLWDISQAQIDELERTGVVRRTLTLHAPASGVVTEKLVVAGQAVEAGMSLYRLADPTMVWIDADIYDHDLRFVRTGAAAEVEVGAYPDARIAGRVSHIYPDVQQATRTARIRITLPNPDASIKPGMFATVHLSSSMGEEVVMVPRDALMRTGARDIVFVEVVPGTFALRPVQAGRETGGRVEILSGLAAGERVVARANFLLDAESRLMESMGAIGDMPGMQH